MTWLTITKNGRVEFEPIEVKSITLKSVTLYLTMHNLKEPTEFTSDGRPKVTIAPGWYTYQDIRSKLPGQFKVHQNTLKVSYAGTLTGGLVNRIENEYLYLTPLYLGLYVDRVNDSVNLVDGKRSKLLDTIPIDVEVGETLHYNSAVKKLLYHGRINNLDIHIKDDLGNDFPGKFIAKLLIE